MTGRLDRAVAERWLGGDPPVTGPGRVLVTGSRDWIDEAPILRGLLDQIRPDGTTLTLVHGACRTGADRIAHRLATAMGWAVEAWPADWQRHGKGAGPRRNAAMVKAGADICLAYIKGGSPGATHCARLAEKAGIPTWRWTA